MCAFMNSGGDAPVPQTPTSRERSAPQPFIAERLATSTEPPGPSPWGLHPPLHTAVPVLPSGLGINPTYTSPRQRLGALPSRARGAGRSVSAPVGGHLLHRHSPISSTKQPNLAAVGENDPYPPANAEVTLELQRQTLKHGRKLIQYSASRPLDTIVSMTSANAEARGAGCCRTTSVQTLGEHSFHLPSCLLAWLPDCCHATAPLPPAPRPSSYLPQPCLPAPQHIKIPNTSPGLLTQPVLANLCHIIDLGHQRIVVGGSLRPGCALLSLDLMDVAGAAPPLRLAPAGGAAAAGGGRRDTVAAGDGQDAVQQQLLLVASGDAGDVAAGAAGAAIPSAIPAGAQLALDASQLLAVLGVVRAATAVPLSSRVQLQAGGAVWEGTFVPVRPDADGAVQGPEQAAEPGRPAGPAQAGDTGGSTTRGQWQWQRLDPWQDSIGWDASSRVAEDGGVFVDAAAPPPTSARASPMSSAETARVEGGAAPDPSAPLPLRRSLHGPSPAAAEPRVQLWVTRQVMLAPAAAGQPLQLSVRVSGLPALGNTSAPLAAHEQAQAAGAGRRAQGGGAAGAVVDGPVSSYAFAVRSLGRYLPVHGVPAPMTPPAAGAPTGEPQAGAAHVTRPGSPGLTGFAASAPGVGCPASPPRTTSAGGLRCSSGLLPTSAFVTEAGLPSGRSSSNGSPVSGASAADLEAAVQAAAAASAPSTGTGTGEEAAVQQAGALRSPSPVNPDGCFELSVAGLGPAAAAAAATAGSSRPHEWQPGPQLVQLELWRDGARVQVASKPLLLLPPGEAALAAELQRLVALQDELSQENGMAAAAAAVAGSALQPPGPSPADQLVSDLGQWLEFVHAELQLSSVPAAAAAPQPAEAQSPPPVLLRGSVDLRDQVLGMRRAAPGYGSSMLCLGMELLEAAVQLRSSTLAGTVMACFGALGYSVAEVWASLGEVDTSEVEAGAVAQGEAREAGAAARLPVLLALVEATGGDADVAGLVQDWAAQAALAAAASAIPAVRAEEAQPAQPAPARLDPTTAHAAHTAQHSAAESASPAEPQPPAAAAPARSVRGLARAALVGFSDAGRERRYQQFLSVRSSASGASWVCVHLALMAAAVLRLASDGRLGLDLPAVLLFSGAYVIMTGVVVADRWVRCQGGRRGVTAELGTGLCLPRVL